MLREIRAVEQRAGEDRRRWFQGPGADLCIWLDAAGRVTRFDFAYRLAGEERMLQWRRSVGGGDGMPGGLRYARVEDGEEDARFSRTPILQGESAGGDARGIAERIRAEAGDALEPELLGFVLDRLREAASSPEE